MFTSTCHIVFLIFIVSITLSSCGVKKQTLSTTKKDVTNTIAEAITDGRAKVVCNDIVIGKIDDDEIEQPTDRDKVNKGIRTLLYYCAQKDLLPENKVTAQKIEDKNAKSINEKGKILEEYNFWYYVEDKKTGQQTATLNVSNFSDTPISWIILGFNPTSCKKDVTEWKYFIRVNLPRPFSGRKQALFTWYVPKGVTLQDGCMNILSAG